MEYLAYFQPDRELSDLILRQNNIVLQSLGLHSTLCFFYMKPEYEYALITDLSKIKFNPFEIKTLGFDNFDEDSLVLRLSRSDELLQLYKKIIGVVRDYTSVEFDKITKQYFENNYNPHLTISKSSSKFNIISKELIGRKNNITRYTLVKKLNGNWKEIQDFCSSR